MSATTMGALLDDVSLFGLFSLALEPVLIYVGHSGGFVQGRHLYCFMPRGLAGAVFVLEHGSSHSVTEGSEGMPLGDHERLDLA